MTDMELFKPYPGSTRYQIGILGTVIGVSGRKMSPVVNNRGYHRLLVYFPGKPRRNMSVHRLVAETFLGDPPDGHEVNHKNGDKLDNRVQNLEWVSKSENLAHSFRIGREVLRRGDHPRAKAVVRDDGLRFDCLADAAESISRTASALGEAIAKGRECCGHKWRWA